jgi:hypothetical protein
VTIGLQCQNEQEDRSAGLPPGCWACAGSVGGGKFPGDVVLDAMVLRGYLTEDERSNGAAIKKAIEVVLSDMELELQFDTAPGRPRV